MSSTDNLIYDTSNFSETVTIPDGFFSEDDMSDIQDAARPTAGRSGSSAGLMREDNSPVAVGVAMNRVDPRKAKHIDLNAATSAPIAYAVTREACMPVEEAEEILIALEDANKLTGNAAAILAFRRALFVQHAINGSSQMQPGRAMITLDVGKKEAVIIDFALVQERLGTNARQFWRAYADDVVAELKRLFALFARGKTTVYERDIVIWAREIAQARGLQRAPWLIADSADKASLNISEQALVNASKVAVLAAPGEYEGLRSVAHMGADVARGGGGPKSGVQQKPS